MPEERNTLDEEYFKKKKEGVRMDKEREGDKNDGENMLSEDDSPKQHTH